jgi:hypothetical protein
MGTQVFDKTFFGRIFNVTLAGSDKSKERSRQSLHLITSLLAFEIYSPSYDKVVQRVTCDRVVSVNTKGDTLTVTCKSDQKSNMTIKLECDKVKDLEVALVPVPANREAPKVSLAMSAVLPSLQLNYSLGEVNAELTKIVDRFLTTLEYAAGSTPPIVGILLCVYKSRFRSAEPRRHVEILSAELRLRFLLHWTAAVQKAASLTDVSHEYLSRIVVNLANTTAIVGDTLDIDAQQLLAASVFFYDEHNASGAAAEADKIARLAQGKLFSIQEGTRDELSDRLYDWTILAIAGRILAVYVHDIEVLRNCCVERVMATSRQALDNKMYKAAKMLIGDMLRKMNDRRFEPAFQYVFALWSLKDVK